MTRGGFLRGHIAVVIVVACLAAAVPRSPDRRASPPPTSDALERHGAPLLGLSLARPEQVARTRPDDGLLAAWALVATGSIRPTPSGITNLPVGNWLTGTGRTAAGLAGRDPPGSTLG